MKKSRFFYRYLGALVYDVFILFALYMAITAGCLWLREGEAIAPGTSWFQLLLVISALMYYCFSCLYGGQTIGMRAWRLKLISKTHSLTLSQVLVRFLFWMPACLISMLILKNPLYLLNQSSESQLIIF